mmetsp:Transcript_4487/g.11273  ORF Transcript_4487/g.11273 Transcript_4487/m.11273 type:complete len:376 (-) Transcript_4487:319-1446(-)
MSMSSLSSSPPSRTKRSTSSKSTLLLLLLLLAAGCFMGSSVAVVSAYQSGIPPSSSSSRRPPVGQYINDKIETNIGNGSNNNNGDGVMDQYEAALRAASSSSATDPAQSTSSPFSDYDPNQQGAATAAAAGTEFGYFSSLGGETGNFGAVTPAFTSPPPAEMETTEFSSPQQQQQPRPSYRIPRSIDTMLEEIESEIQAVDEQLRLTAPPSTVQDYVQDATYVLNSVMSDAMVWWNSPEGQQTRTQLVEHSRNVLEHTVVKTQQVVHTAKETWDEEDGDVSKFSQQILRKMQDSAEQAKVVVTVKVKETVESEDFKNLPKQSMNALNEFWVSDQVVHARKTASEALMKALKSEKMTMEVRQRSTKSPIQDTFQQK